MSCMPGVPHTTRRERPVTPFGPGQGGYWDRRAGWESHTYAQWREAALASGKKASFSIGSTRIRS